jgi:hypothetical protein
MAAHMQHQAAYLQQILPAAVCPCNKLYTVQSYLWLWWHLALPTGLMDVCLLLPLLLWLPLPAAWSFALHVLLTGAFAPLGGLEYFGTTVVPLLVVLCLPFPVPLMLQGGAVIVQVPGGVGHVLWDMRVDLLALLIDFRWRETRFTGLLQLFLPTEVI